MEHFDEARFVLPALALFACGEPLDQVELIDKTRIIGAKVEVGGDPGRAAPLPGEDVRVRVLVVAPAPDPTFAYHLEACVATDSRSPVPECVGALLGAVTSLDPLPTPPTIDFVAPVDADGDERLAVTGHVCPDGVALSGTGETRCTDGTRALELALDFTMDDGLHPNTNPAFSLITIDGDELLPETAASTDCALLPAILPGSRHTLRVELDPSSRDALLQETAADPAAESLLVSYHVTSGEFEHAFSAIESTAPSNAVSTVWTAPGRVDGARLLTRFVLVVRDGRGGSDIAERRVCFMP
jgi:hypothetical protein